MKKLNILLIIAVLFNTVISCSEVIETNDVGDNHEVYEMRVYYTHEGKFDDILSRFENHTTKLFEKHGFTNVGYWTTTKRENITFADEFIFQNDGNKALVYIVSFKDMDARDNSWDNFINDPEWTKAYEESRVNGPIVRKIEQVFLSPTVFSNLK
ncbi:MAG: NIPSNAP family protein [Cryomorphaceae bacterium]|nr:NIPSNAP family protein [Cryomorphaceae bacterium]